MQGALAGGVRRHNRQERQDAKGKVEMAKMQNDERGNQSGLRQPIYNLEWCCWKLRARWHGRGTISTETCRSPVKRPRYSSDTLGEVLVELDHGQGVTLAVLPQVHLGFFRRLTGQVAADHERERRERSAAVGDGKAIV